MGLPTLPFDPFAGLALLIEQANKYVSDLIRGIEERIASIIRAIFAQVSNIMSELGGIVRTIVGVVEETVSNLIANITVALGNVATFIGQIPQRLGDFAHTVEAALQQLPDEVFKGLGTWIGANWPKLLEWLGMFAPNLEGEFLTDPLARQFGPLGQLAERIMRGKVSAAELFTAGTPAEIQSPLQHILYGGAFFAGAFLALLTAGVPVAGRELQQEMNVGAQTVIPDIDRVIRSDRRGLADPGAIDEMRQRNGVGPSVYNWLRDLATEPIPPGEVLDLYNRGGRDPQFLKAKLLDAGLHERDLDTFAQLADIVPPVQDVLRFLTRDNFIPEIVDQFGMALEFEQSWQVGQRFFEQVGITKAVALEYWKAHWDVPSTGQAFQMFFRTAQEDTPGSADFPGVSKGQHFIDEPTLRRLLRAQGVEPFWRDKIIAIAFSPLTRVDVRRMHRVGVLSADEVKDAYLNLGYNEINATRLRDFVVKLNGADEQAQIHALRSPVANRVLNTYRKHYLTREDADAHLKALDYTDAARAELLATADLDIAEAYATAAEAEARAGYVSGVRGADATSALLSQAGFGQETISRLLKVWDIARQNRELSVEEKQHRELTRAEIIEAYNDHIVTRDQAGAMLVHAGFDVHAADQLLSIADVRVKRAELKDLESGIHGRFVAGKITAGQAVSELDALGVSPARRTALLATWDLEIQRRESRIPVATVQAMVGQRIMTAEDARKELAASGLGAKEIGWYFQLWGVVAAPKLPGEG